MVEGQKKRRTTMTERNPILSGGHYTEVPARKTKLKDKVDDQNEKVFACKYCVCAFDKNEIKRYRSGGIWKDPNTKVHAMEKWLSASSAEHLAKCKWAPDEVKERDFRRKRL
eukprot:scaffold5673_cov73-Skeletonema_marinoi.AAC.1